MANNIPTFNLATEAARKLMTIWVDVSENGTPEWEIQGYKTAEMAIEFNPETTTETDILGDTYTSIDKLERSMNFDPNTIRAIEIKGGKLNPILHEYTRRNQLEKLANFKVLVVYGYIGDETDGYQADLYPQCTIIPQSLGGSSKVNFPYNISPGGTTVYGTVDQLGNGLTFTPES